MLVNTRKMEKSDQKIETPAWLKDLQENSWNLELLISGGAIFTLFQLETLFVDFMLGVKITSHIAGTSIFIIIGMLALKILTVGFISHILLRSFWLSLVCINFVFPKGVGKEKRNLQKPFKNSFTTGKSLQNEINKIDRAAGLVMFISVLSTIVLLGFVFLTFSLITLPSMIGGFNNLDFYFYVMVGLIVFYYIDLFLFGSFRKVKFLSYILYPIFKLFDIISLRLVFQKGLALFSTNVSKTKSFIGFVFMIFIASFFTYTAIYKLMRWPNMSDSRAHRWTMIEKEIWASPILYRDISTENDGKLYAPSIQSEMITNNTINLYVPYDIDFDFDIPVDGYLENSIDVYIGDSLYSNLIWINNKQRDNDLLGMKCYIDIQNLKRGFYKLKIQRTATENKFQVIPFWKE